MDPLKQARRLAVLVIGSTVLLGGVALLVLPGPAFIVIPIGLAILSTEFVWAARLLKRVKENAAYAAQTVMGNGVDFMMHTHKWHGVAPNNEQLEKALAQLPETAIGDY